MQITRRQLLAALALLVVLIAAILLESLVVTEREEVTTAMEAMADACGDADVPRFFAHVSPGYGDARMGYNALQDVAAKFFRRYGPVRVRVRHTVVKLSHNAATADADVVAQSVDNELSGSSQWRLDFEKDMHGRWRLVHLIPLKIGHRDVDGWNDALLSSGLH